MKKLSIIFSIIFVFGLFVAYNVVTESWKYTGRNLQKAKNVALGEACDTAFEKAVSVVSIDGSYVRTIFPLPSIMAHPDGHIVLRSKDNIIVEIRISETTNSSEELSNVKWRSSR